MKHLFTFLIILFFTGLRAQWTTIASPTNVSLFSIDFNKLGAGVISGTNGHIISTVDSGKTWKDSIYIPAYQNRAVKYAGNSNVVVGAEVGHHFRSVNAGSTFAHQGVIASFGDMKAISFANDTLGFAVDNGCNVARTTNAGSSWTVAGTPCTDGSGLNNLASPTAQVVYVCGAAGNAWKSTTKGSSWTALTLPEPTSDYVSLFFFNDTAGFFGGVYNASSKKGMLCKTTNGGTTFTDMTDSLKAASGGGTVSAMHWLNMDTGYVAVGKKVYKTTDGGITWTTDHTSSDNINSLGVFYNRLYAVGFSGQIAYTAIPAKQAPVINSIAEAGTLTIMVYPNPAADVLHLSFPSAEAAYVQICNMLGEVVLNEQTQGQSIAVSNLKGGIYTGTVTPANTLSRYTFRFVKQ
jgi:photosystem II stability/assembly factor-like uncharacterized protein